eukprot:1522283-Pyramimonas_sp.AAC.1
MRSESAAWRGSTLLPSLLPLMGQWAAQPSPQASSRLATGPRAPCRLLPRSPGAPPCRRRRARPPASS